MARKKPAKRERTRVSNVYKDAAGYLVRIYNPDKNGKPGYDNYRVASWDDALGLKRDKEREKKLHRRLGDRLTVEQWARRWLELFPRGKESTDRHNAERVRAYTREFGDRMLPGVSPLEAREWAVANRSRVPAVRAMLNDACKVHVCQDNPFNGLRLERSKGRTQIRVLTGPELARLTTVAILKHGEFGESVFAPMIETAAWTGLRPGELFALEPQHVDFARGEILVEAQWHSRLRRIEPTKNALRRRVVLLPGAERALRGVQMRRGEPVFRTVNESRFSQRALHYYWDPVRTAFAAAMPEDHWVRTRGNDLDFYELRHFFGTQLAHKGATPYEIADQMGHTDGGKIAMSVYVHQDSETARESIRARFRAGAPAREAS